MSPTDSLEVFTSTLFDLVEANKVTLGVVDLFYSDQWRIPRTPTICVQSSRKTRQIIGAPRRSENQLEAYILIYHSRVAEIQQVSHDADLMAEAVETVVHADPTLGGIVVHSLVVLNEGGYRYKQDTQFRASRLTVQGSSVTFLPMNPNYNNP